MVEVGSAGRTVEGRTVEGRTVEGRTVEGRTVEGRTVEGRTVEVPIFEVPMVDVGVGEYLSDVPSSRFPVYTRGNAGEVWPEVAYPLTVSLSRAVGEDLYTAPTLATGLIEPADIVEGPVCFGGVFGGYMYLDVSINRVVAIRSPGITIEQSDATFLGTEGVAPPHRPHPDDKNWRASLRGTRFAWRVLGRTSVPHLEDDRRLVDGWRRRVPQLLEADDAQLVATLLELVRPTTELFARHIEVTLEAAAAVQALASICDDRLGDRAAAFRMLAGIGGVDSAAPSYALWDLGRLVADDATVAAEFDRGVVGLDERLRSDARADPFVSAFDAFLEQYGSRGPNEWETACETWATDHALPLALVDRMRRASDDHDPARRRGQLVAEREHAVAEARARVGRSRRWLFERALRSSTVLSQARERSKTIVVDLIQVSRLLARELDRRLVARGGGTSKDLWFVLAHELDDYVADPAAFQVVVRERRRVRDELSRRIPPFVFDGSIPAADTWPLRDDVAHHDLLGPGDVISGIGGCPGVAEGRARVVTDPGDPGDLGPGDVLVAPLTDPSWTPLFVPVEAIVVDVGGQMSHAVIVSRELGRPCVVSATGATSRIPDGAVVRVDGDAATVTIVSVPG
jgi:rifampicin phosphotransferase